VVGAPPSQVMDPLEPTRPFHVNISIELWIRSMMSWFPTYVITLVVSAPKAHEPYVAKVLCTSPTSVHEPPPAMFDARISQSPTVGDPPLD